MSVLVVFHGDCDGIIAAYLYIKRYLKDLYPSGLTLAVTHPWRAHTDIKRLATGGNELIILDIALSERLVNILENASSRYKKVIFVDHHATSESLIKKLEPKIKVLYSKVTSTPRLLAQFIGTPLNPYEDVLVEVADICEGKTPYSGIDKSALDIVDSIRMSIAFDPGDLGFMKHLIDLMMKSKNPSQDPLVRLRTRRAKFLLENLLRILSEDSLDADKVKMAFLNLPLSRAFAGLIGVAATELSKAYRKSVILIREEQDKIVVTIRSTHRDALNISQLIANSLGGVYGGHAEASSITIGREPLSKVVNSIIDKVLKPEISKP
ncbi:MAG: DHH family phosphoesterase [Sulfolobales archaeon]|nr:DHH family phosphoesterase [Sulfolobales archaeon]MDW8083139.1 DHH family phosphoesterase [Sulfolobales archaeon]